MRERERESEREREREEKGGREGGREGGRKIERGRPARWKTEPQALEHRIDSGAT